MFVYSFQLDAKCGDYKSNIENVIDILKSNDVEQGSTVLFPELIDYGYNLSLFRPLSFTPFFKYKSELEEIAHSKSLTILLGGAFFDGFVLENSIFMIRPKGKLKPVYFKNNLFGNEDSVFYKGSDCKRVNIDGVNCGFHICFDIRFPELTRSFLPTRPEILFVSAAWPQKRIAHWEILLRARAIENQCFIVASNRTGTDNGIQFGGNSMIISPKGDVVAQAKDDELFIKSKLDLEELHKYRVDFPL